MRVFISQPMNGRTREECITERELYYEAFKKWLMANTNDFKFDLFSLIENYDKPNAPENAPRLWYLADSLKLMADADYVVFVPGWKKAKGCKIEMLCCKLYGIPYIKMKKI